MPSDDEPRERLERGRTGSSEPPSSIEDLESVRVHPDPRADLGYETTDWERIAAADGSDQLVFLPAEEEMLLQDAFIIATDSDLRDLEETR